MGDILVDLASRMLRLMSLWGCGNRGSDIHQIHRSVGPPERMRAEPAALGMDVAELDIGIVPQPVAAFGLADANRFANQAVGGRCRGLLLERAMHPLVPPVLLRL